MGTFLSVAATSAGLSVALARFAPQYSLGVAVTAVTLFVIQSLSYAIWHVVIYPRFIDPLRHIPEPPARDFLLGHTKNILREPTGWPMRKWIADVPNNGFIRYSMWFRRRLLLTTPATLSEVLVTKNYDFVKPGNIVKTLGRILGIGILFAEGDEHKMQRKNLSPAFAFRHIKNIYPIFWQKSIEMTDCMAAAVAAAKAEPTNTSHDDGTAKPDIGLESQRHERRRLGVIEVGNWASRATLDIIGLCGMGRDFNSLQDPSNELNKTYKSLAEPGSGARILGLAALFLPFWLLKLLPIKRNTQLSEASAYIKQVCRDLIIRKRKDVLEEKAAGTDILSVALDSGAFSDEELVNQMMTFLIAGHETTATSMTWAIYLMCKHPDIQKKLRAEVRSSIPHLHSEITAATIDDCHYLQAVCNETLRLWAPVGLTSRVAACDTTIQGQFIPKGTAIILAPATINTSTELWGPDALEFKPERFLGPDGKANNQGSAKSNFAFLTFLHGPRSCIGQRFAQAEFACILAAWIGRFETAFEQDSAMAKGELEVRSGVTSKPKGGVWVTVEEVAGW